jgi:hypothetical protein
MATRTRAWRIQILQSIVDPTLAVSKAKGFLLLGRSGWHVPWSPEVHSGQFGSVGDGAGDAMSRSRVAQGLVVGRAQMDVLLALFTVSNGGVLSRRQFLPLARAYLTEHWQRAIADSSLGFHRRLRRVTRVLWRTRHMPRWVRGVSRCPLRLCSDRRAVKPNVGLVRGRGRRRRLLARGRCPAVLRLYVTTSGAGGASVDASPAPLPIQNRARGASVTLPRSASRAPPLRSS